MSQVLLGKISSVRRKQFSVTAGRGVAFAVMGLIVGMGLTMALDWWVELPRVVRAAALALELAGVGWLAWAYLVSPILFGPDDDAIALAVERDDNRYRGRLISAVQLSRKNAIPSGASLALVRALVAQTEAMSAAVDFGHVVRTDRFAKISLAAFCMVLLAGGGFVFGRPSSGDLLRRAVLIEAPVPRKTRVIDVTGNAKVPRGEGVTIVARAEGIKPQGGRVVVRYPHVTISYDMDADAKTPGQYARTIESVQESFTYKVYLNDGHGQDCAVEAVNRPNVAEIVCFPIYPAYTRIPIAARKAGELSMLQGSGLDFIVIPDKDLAITTENDRVRNRVELSSAGQAGVKQSFALRIFAGGSPPAQVALRDAGLALASLQHMDAARQEGFAREFAARYAGRSVAVAGNHRPDPERFNTYYRGVPLPAGTTGLSIHLVDADGFQNKDPAVHHIELLPDLPPHVEVVGRPKEELATRTARIDVEYVASDDYGLTRISLRRQTAGGPVVDVPIRPADKPDVIPRSVGDTFRWQLKDIPADVLPENPDPDKRTIQFWLHAEDNNDATSPNKRYGEFDGDRYQIRIVSDEDKRKELMARFGALPAQIDPVKKDQTDLSDKLGNVIVHGGAPTTRPR